MTTLTYRHRRPDCKTIIAVAFTQMESSPVTHDWRVWDGRRRRLVTPDYHVLSTTCPDCRERVRGRRSQALQEVRGGVDVKTAPVGAAVEAGRL